MFLKQLSQFKFKHVCDFCKNFFERPGHLHRGNIKNNNKHSFCNRSCSIAFKKQGREHTPNFKNGSINTQGYVVIPVPVNTPDAWIGKRGARILEHRYLWQNKIGNKIGYILKKSDTIHHKNGIRTDNRIENLELRYGQHGSGATELTEPINRLVTENEILRKQLSKFNAEVDQNQLIGNSV